LPKEDREKKYSFPTFKVDLSGAIMLQTLEHFAFTSGWSTKKQFLEDPTVAAWENPTSGTRVNVRFLRYTRAGLLQRRRTGGRYEYEYRLSSKGVDRYVFMLKSGHLLDPAFAKTPEDRDRMLNRLAVTKLLRRQQIIRLESQLQKDRKAPTASKPHD
jgi:hypothetical protein